MECMKILFLLYPAEVASGRYRARQYLDYLIKEGFSCQTNYLHNGKFITKWIYRLKILLHLPSADIVFLQKAISVSDKLFNLIKRFKKKLVYDFDDALFLTPGKDRFLEIIKMSDLIITGNNFLKENILSLNSKIIVIPTTVDTDKYQPRRHTSANKLIIGWIGSKTTNQYVNYVSRVITTIGLKYKIAFKIISSNTEDVKLNEFKNVDLVFKKWNLQTEINDLLSIDIGIMPLPDDGWTKGKCGLKALQYMACGIPAICSPVGVTREIIKDGINGYLADSEEEWISKLGKLIEDEPLRNKVGAEGRATVEKHYSLKVNAPKLKEALEGIYKI